MHYSIIKFFANHIKLLFSGKFNTVDKSNQPENYCLQAVSNLETRSYRMCKFGM